MKIGYISPNYKKPKLKPIDLIPMEGDRLQIRHMERVFVLEGSSVRTILPVVIPHISGDLTFDEIVEKTGVEASVVAQLLTLLDSKRLLEEGESESFHISPKEIEQKKEYLDFFSSFPHDSLKTLEKLKNSTINIVGEGVIASEICSELKNVGVFVNFYSVKEIDGAKTIEAYDREFFKNIDNALTVLAFPHFPVGVLEDANEIFTERKISFLPVYIEHMKGIVGPLVIPGETPCFKCFELRVDANQDHFSEYQSYKNYLKSENKFITPPSFLQKSLVYFPVMESIRILSECEFPSLLGYFIELDFATMESTRNLVLKLPRCPVCGATLKQPAYDHYFLSR